MRAVIAVTVMHVLLLVLHVCILRECEGGDGNDGVGDGRDVVVVSAGHVGGTTRGSCIVSSAADVLWMRGVGEVCEMCMCLARGGVGVEVGEWMRGLGLGFTNPVRTGGVLGVCLCLSCGGVGGEWVGAWTRFWSGGWCYVYMRCGSGLSVYMAGTDICVLFLADTCASEVHLVFNPVTPYGYLLPNMDLFIEDIINPDSFV